MQELSQLEISQVSGGDGGQVTACLSGASLGSRVGGAFGAWGGVAGAVLGCGAGLYLYNS